MLRALGIHELQLQGGGGVADFAGSQILAGGDKISPAILATPPQGPRGFG